MITNDREYRSFEFRANDEKMTVEGYAAVFDQETILYERDGVSYREIVERSAFESAQMVDVVMNFNHSGKPVARTKNNTLELKIDHKGLFIRADLSGTDEGRNLYEEIRGGYIDKMSFAFTVSGDDYNQKTRTRTIKSVKRLYDVAAVDLPAYEQTSIQARSFFKIESDHDPERVRVARAKYFHVA